MKINHNSKYEKYVAFFFIIFYIVGIALFAFKSTQPLFISITPLALFMNIAIIFYFHKQWNLKSISIFSFIIIFSFLIEMLGVSSGRIFGNYIYDKGLGIKLMNTPLIIGINWLFLVYASQSIVSNYLKNIWYRITLSTCLMIFYDIIMEWVAPSMQMWHFTTPYPPIKNFIAWFFIALVFQMLVVAAKIKVDNYPAKMLFWLQMIFFIIIGIIESN